jgi:hypothetical protein
MLPFAVVQGSLVIYIRIFGSEYALEDEVTPLMTPIHDPNELSPRRFDIELGSAERVADSSNAQEPDTLAPETTNVDASLIMPSFQAIGARGLVDISQTGGFGNAGSNGSSSAPRLGHFSEAEMARVAARLQAEEEERPSGGAA